MEDTLVSDLCTPVFIVDLQKVKQNAQAMLERFQQMGVQLRPHMKTHKTVMKAAGMDGPKSSIGSTPSCSHPVQDMAQLSEVHPGNYIFYDAQQMKIGSCKLEQVAVRVLTRVIGHYPSRNQLLVDCGWAGLSHDGGGCLPTGYAIIEGHPNLRLLSMTQEHGRVEPISGNLDYKKFPIGAMLCLIPYHACATAMMHAIFFVHSEGKVVDKWTPTRGW